VSEQTPPAPGDFGVGSHVAGYRLDEQIGRGGMAVVYRAHDARLDRRVALKILAPELARDEEFRQRFIRESRAAAAVDHANIIPIYEAGEADGVLFIAMRFVDGRDVQTLINQLHPLPTARVCDIVTQVASALDAAHVHGLVHRDVKPGNMLRDATSGRAQPDHVYLSDFGLSKQSLGASAALTSQGQFLGTLNYVAPEQIEGRPVDGRTDEYALACSAFEMLAGQPPFRRDETLAIMWAQLSSAPPSLTGMRPDLPTAVDGVIAKALSKAPDDRYGTCLEFATALRQACGIRTGSTAPGKVVPGPGATRGVRPDELAAASGAAAATGRAGPSVPPPGAPGGGAADTGVTRTGMVPAAPAGRSGAGPDRGGQPTQAGRVPGVRPTKPGLTDPVGDYGQLYRPTTPPAAPPARRSRRTLAVVLAACVVVAAAGGAYLLLGRGGGGGSGGGHAATATRVLTLPGCTTATAQRPAALRGVRTHFVQVGGKPFDVVVSPNNFGFVSLRNGQPLVVMNTAKFVPTVIQQVPLANPEGEAFTHNRQYLLVAGDSGMTVFRVRDLEAGLTAPLGSLTSPGGKGALQVVPSPDDKFAFVALQNSGNVAVFNLHKALTAGFGPADFVGMIPMRSDPTGMAASPDGRYLYVVSGLAGTALQSGMGTLAIVDMRKAETSPGSSVVKVDNAGCGPARVLASPDGKYVWVTSGGGNTLEAFSAPKLLSDSGHALVAKVAVGQIPLGLALVNNGTRMVVADSNRDSVGTSGADLMVIDVDKALAGKPALVGTIKSGVAPRQFALEPNGKTLLVTNTGSGQLEAVNVGQIP
jgi:DNA-binding beta-propeller fold protein YncE/tRNA A-37 threonylcarbamoyl transferase component Bud32